MSACSPSQAPIAQATLPDSGGTVEDHAADASVGLGSLSLLSAHGIANDVAGSVAATTATAMGRSRVARATLLGGLITVDDLVATTRVAVSYDATGTPTYAIEGDTHAQAITIAGQSVRLGRIPPNTVVPLVAPVEITILGVALRIPHAREALLFRFVHASVPQRCPPSRSTL